MGNRVFSLLSAILYARLTGRRLLVDWSDPSYSNDRSNSVHRFFDSKEFDPSDEIPETKSVRPAIWRDHLRESVRAMVRAHMPTRWDDPLVSRPLSIDVSRVDCEEDLLVFWSYFPLIDAMRRHFRGPFAVLHKLDTFTILKQLIRESLQLHPEIRERVRQIKGSWPAGPVLGVHVRYSDKKTRFSVIQQKVAALLSQHPGMRLFLATDNKSIEDLFERTWPGTMTAPKWYPSATKKMHENEECPDKVRNGVEALIDLYLLADCDYLVVDTSSAFSHLATILSDRDRSRIRDVRPWGWLPPRMRDWLWLIYQWVRCAPQRFPAFWRK
jgi:hypothetical protein